MSVFGPNSAGETFTFTTAGNGGGAEDVRPQIGFFPDAEVLSFPAFPPRVRLRLPSLPSTPSGPGRRVTWPVSKDT